MEVVTAFPDSWNWGKAIKIDGFTFVDPTGSQIHAYITAQACYDLGWTAAQFDAAFHAGRVQFGYVDEAGKFRSERI